MKEEEVTSYIKESYPLFDKNLLSIEKSLVDILNYYISERKDLYEVGDFRPGTIGRMISSVIATRFYLNQITNFINTENWSETFQHTYTPKPFKGNGYFGHFKDIDLVLRFNLFHQIYHQLETTQRIICRNLNLTEKIKPIERINKITKSFPPEFIEYLEAVRNTIHNNGYYQPVSKKQRAEFSFELPPITLSFKENERIELGMDETLSTIKQLVVYVKHMLLHSEIEKIEIITDKN